MWYLGKHPLYNLNIHTGHMRLPHCKKKILQAHWSLLNMQADFGKYSPLSQVSLTQII